MSSKTILGYAAKGVGQPLEPFSFEPPKLGENDIRVSVSHCGVCHTDIQAIDDFYNITTFPFFPGHEIVGLVSEVGNAVTDLKENDRVGIGWEGRSCGHCEWCLKGEEQLCYDIVDDAAWLPYGGFSSSVVVDHRFAYVLPDAMPSEVAAVLMCAGITVYNPLRTYAMQNEKKLAIVGVGGLGHLALQFAKALDYEVTAISSSLDKKEQALAFGAQHFIVSTDKKSMRQVDYGFDLLVITANDGIDWEALLMTMKKRGKLILLGFPDVKFNSTDLVAHELSLTGSFLGNRAMMKEMLSFARAHTIAPMLELMPMSRVNEALQKVRENKARYRIVLVNDTTTAGS